MENLLILACSGRVNLRDSIIDAVINSLGISWLAGGLEGSEGSGLGS